MTIFSAGLAPFTPEVSFATNRNVSPLCGRIAPVRVAPGAAEHSVAVHAGLVLDRVALEAEPGGARVEAHHRRRGARRAVRSDDGARRGTPATRHSAPPATNTGVGRVTFPTAQSMARGESRRCSAPPSRPGSSAAIRAPRDRPRRRSATAQRDHFAVACRGHSGQGSSIVIRPSVQRRSTTQSTRSRDAAAVPGDPARAARRRSLPAPRPGRSGPEPRRVSPPTTQPTQGRGGRHARRSRAPLLDRSRFKCTATPGGPHAINDGSAGAGRLGPAWSLTVAPRPRGPGHRATGAPRPA